MVNNPSFPFLTEEKHPTQWFCHYHVSYSDLRIRSDVQFSFIHCVLYSGQIIPLYFDLSRASSSTCISTFFFFLQYWLFSCHSLIKTRFEELTSYLFCWQIIPPELCISAGTPELPWVFWLHLRLMLSLSDCQFRWTAMS